MDLTPNYCKHLLIAGSIFQKGISIHREWIEYYIRKCDICHPRRCHCHPIEYVRNPSSVRTGF